MKIVATYLAYLLVLILSVATLLVWRSTVQLVVGALDVETTARPLLYAVAMVLIVVGLFIGALAAEPYLRHGLRRGQLGRRILRLVIPLVAILVAGLIVQEIILRFA